MILMKNCPDFCSRCLFASCGISLSQTPDQWDVKDTHTNTHTEITRVIKNGTSRQTPPTKMKTTEAKITYLDENIYI